MTIFNQIKKIFKKDKTITPLELEKTYLSIKKNVNIYSFQDKFKNQNELLLKVFGKVETNLQNKIKLIVISDTHNSLNEQELIKIVNNHKNYDACLLLGDHSSQDLNKILNHIPKEKIYALLGNHDTAYINTFNLNNLNGNIVEIKNVKILGIEGSFKYKPAKFPSFTQEESINFLKDKQKSDIIVSHDGPFDETKQNNPAHQGLFGITYYLFKNKVKYNIHGHIHDTYEKELINGTKEISVFGIQYIELI